MLLLIADFTIYSSLEQFVVVYGIIAILDHQNIGVDLTFSVLSCLVQEI